MQVLGAADGHPAAAGAVPAVPAARSRARAAAGPGGRAGGAGAAAACLLGGRAGHAAARAGPPRLPHGRAHHHVSRPLRPLTTSHLNALPDR